MLGRESNLLLETLRDLSLTLEMRWHIRNVLGIVGSC